tara:strand:- start:6109 stop:7800 length:1692 start_codon:yes stop_codon:yes gene_type:complete
MRSDSLISQTNLLKEGIFKCLLRRLPPKSNSRYLKDIINILLEALLDGEIEVSLSNKDYSYTSNVEGWPDSHLKELKESGWLNKHNSPVIIKDDKILFNRWNIEIKKIFSELKKRNDSLKTINKISGEVNLSKFNRQQKVAINAIQENKVVFISGGPGTGKTSTIIGIIERMVNNREDLKIGLAAPTGKASRRLKESIQKSINKKEFSHLRNLGKIPCKTIHSWLEVRNYAFSKNSKNQLNLDLLIVDEMSMVDISLMNSILSSLPFSSQLLLVGDYNQLPPIGTGDVWKKIIELDKNLFNYKNFINLDEVFRNNGELAYQSKFLCDNNLKTFWGNILNRSEEGNLKIEISNDKNTPEKIINRLLKQKSLMNKLAFNIEQLLLVNYRQEQVNNSNLELAIKNAFHYLDNLMVLCVQRSGVWGINDINLKLIGEKYKEGISQLASGTPVICSKNQHELGLANGDIGLIVGEGKEKRLLFRIIDEENTIKNHFVHPSRVKNIEPAFAITIHKAQGSEANEVFILWPEKISDCNRKQSRNEMEYSKRLLYTGITRAKNNATILTRR